mgnify:CR=1 FL=1
MKFRSAYLLLVGIFVAFLSGCVSTADVMREKNQLDARFVYRYDIGDEWIRLASSGTVYGDCEDYAITLQEQVGGTLWIGLPVNTNSAHAFLCHGNTCVDNNSAAPFPLNPQEFEWLRRVPVEEIRRRLEIQTIRL